MRPFAWLAVLCLAVLWLALPESEPAAVAVQRIPTLLEARIEGSETSLADRLLELAQPAPGAAHSRVLALGGVRMTVPGVGSDDLTIHARARRAAIAALRQSAHGRGLELEIEGEHTAVAGAANVLFSLHEGRLSARVGGAGVDVGASIDAPPSDRRALLPALAAIALVLLWRRPLVALSCGLAAGALLFAQLPAPAPRPIADAPGELARLCLGELQAAGAWKPWIALTLLLSTWAITARNGGLGGWNAWLSARASTPRRVQLASLACAAAAFFAAPARNVALGWLLRTSAARARISSEKFAWLLDSGGSAALGLCAISPWAIYALGLASAQAGGSLGAGELWLATLSWRAFSIATLGLALAVAWSGRDFGPMLAAERRAREGAGLHARGARRVFAAPEPDPRTPLHAWRALAPFAVFALSLLAQGLRAGGVLSGGFDPGSRASWAAVAEALAHPDVTLIAALAALLVALALSSVGGAERGVPVALARSLRSAIRPALLVLGAWALAFVSGRLGAAEVLGAALGDRVAPGTLPALLFALSAGASFCFGSAWVMLPLLLPLGCGLAVALGPDFAAGATALQLLSIAAILEGTLAGALLAPWSASSLSASIGAGADHTDHLRTQSPYALMTMCSVLVLGFLPAGLFGLGPVAALALIGAAHAAVFVWLSRPSERRAPLPAA